MESWDDSATIAHVQSRLNEPPAGDFSCEDCGEWAGEDDSYETTLTGKHRDRLLCGFCFWKAFEKVDAETQECWATFNRLSIRDPPTRDTQTLGQQTEETAP